MKRGPLVGDGGGGQSRSLAIVAAVAALLVAALGPTAAVARQSDVAVPEEVAAQTISDPPPATPPQPSFDGIRLIENGQLTPYSLYVKSTPVLKTGADGGAWIFFTARPRVAEEGGDFRIYAARYDPAAGVWSAATAIPGGVVQFGPAAAVDPAGTTHLIFSERAVDDPQAPNILMYTAAGADGVWATPVPVAPHPNAGAQVMADLTIDRDGTLHAIWRDQRNVDPATPPDQRTDGDLFVGSFRDGVWSEPVRIAVDDPEVESVAWPHLEADGDRLVAIWSEYGARETGETERRAARVAWSVRPLADATGWSAPATLIEPKGGEIGSLLVDLAADPGGGLAVVSTRLQRGEEAEAGGSVALLRLPAGADAWSEERPLASGDLGYFPTVAVADGGAAFAAFNFGNGRRVEVGLIAIALDDAQRAAALVVPTGGETGEHGRPSLAVGADGRPWLVYMHGETGATSVELRVVRGVAVTE